MLWARFYARSLVVAALLSLPAVAAATTVTGTIKDSAGTAVTGTIYLRLSQEGIAGGILYLAPPVSCPVTAGVIGTCSVQGNDTIQPAGTRYSIWVHATDTAGARGGRRVLPERLYEVTGATWDIGTQTPNPSSVQSGVHGSSLHSGDVIPGAEQLFGSFYARMDEIPVPADPPAGSIHYFLDQATGELSVRKSDSTTVSLEAGGGGSLTVREVDGTPAVANVTVTEFDQADGFVVSDQTGGVARVELNAIPLAAVAFDPILETELDDEAELEAQLVGVTEVFTNNDTIPDGNIADSIARDSEISLPNLAGGAAPANAYDFALATLEIPNSITPPGTCNVGIVYHDTDAAAGSRYLLCTSLNTLTGIDNPFGSAIDDGELASNYSGVGPCTNQAVTAVNDNAAPTCTTLTSAYVDSSIELDTHASEHQHGGADEVATATPGANAIPKADVSNKLAAGWLQEVLGIADLSDFASKSGSGTAAIGSTITTPSDGDLLGYNTGNWLNVTPHAGTSITADLEEEAHTGEHQHGGADEVATATPGANAIPKADVSNKLAAGWLQEVLGIADLSDFTGKSGSGTTAIGSTITTPATNHYAGWDGGNWINRQVAFSELSGTASDAQVDGSLEADELVLAGDVDGAANANDIDELAVETELEGVLDLPDLQGQIADAQIADGAVDGGTGGEIADGTITSADIDNSVASRTGAQGLQNKTIDSGLATTTHAANANFSQGLRHATDCTSITDGLVGEVCQEQDANVFYVCENGAGCTVPGDWIQYGGAGGSHNILSATHSDTLAASVVRGDIIVGNTTPAWSRLAVGGANSILGSNGNDPSWEASTGTGSPVRGTNPTLTDVTVDDVVEFTETAGDATCSTGNYNIKGNSSTGKLRGCENGTLFDVNTLGGFDVIDDTSMQWVDEFVSTPLLSSGNVGDLGWGLSVTGGAVAGVNGNFDNPGILRLSTGTSANDDARIYLRLSNLDPMAGLNSNANWDTKWVFNLQTSTSDNILYIGFSDTNDVPTDGIYLRWDATQPDTNFIFVCDDAGGTSTADSGIAPALSTWYSLRMRSTTAGTVLFSINGGAESPVSANCFDGTVMPLFHIETNTTAFRRIYVDRWAMRISGSGGGSGTPAWETLANLNNALTTYSSDDVAELFQMDFTANYGAADVLFDVEQLTGNPLSGSVLARFKVGDPDMIPLLVKAAPSHLVNVFRVETSAAGSLFTVSPSGNIDAQGAGAVNTQFTVGGVGPRIQVGDDTADNGIMRSVDSSNGLTGSFTARGGDSSHASGNAAPMTVRGGNLTNVSASGVAGDLTVEPGSMTGASATGTQGTLFISNAYIEGASATVGDLQCLSGDFTVTDCTTDNVKNWVGVLKSNTGVTMKVQMAGVATVNHASASPSAGWYACTTTGGAVVVQAAECPAAQTVGIVVKGGAAVTTSPVQLVDRPGDVEEETHASEHQNGGGDEVATATPGANAIPKADGAGDLADGWIPDGVSRDSESAAAGDISGSLSGGYTIDAGAVASTELATANKTPQLCWTFFDTGTDLPDTLDVPSIWMNRARAITVTEVRCEINAGSASINLQRDDGSPANILSSNLACSTAGANGTIDTNEDNLAVGNNIDHVTVSVAASLRRLNVCVTYTVD